MLNFVKMLVVGIVMMTAAASFTDTNDKGSTNGPLNLCSIIFSKHVCNITRHCEWHDDSGTCVHYECEDSFDHDDCITHRDCFWDADWDTCRHAS